MSNTENEEDEKLVADFKGDSKYTIPVVKVIVGSLAQTFYIHKSRLVEVSPFFEACLSAGMIEQQKNEIILPEDPCRGFSILADWIYNHQVPKINDNRQVMSTILAWTLGDKYRIPKFQNALMDKLRGYFRTASVNPLFLLWVAKNTKDTTPLHRYFIDQLTHDLVNHSEQYGYGDKKEEMESEVTDMYAEALTDLLANPEVAPKLFWATAHLTKGGVNPASMKGCFYHVHEEGEICPQGRRNLGAGLYG